MVIYLILNFVRYQNNGGVMSNRFRIHKVEFVDAEKKRHLKCKIIEDLDTHKFALGPGVVYDLLTSQDISFGQGIESSVETLVFDKEKFLEEKWFGSFDKAIDAAFRKEFKL